MNEITINGNVYVLKNTDTTQQYYLVRTESAGVFAGYIESRAYDSVVMRDARRIWYWDGAASLSELAIHGTSKPENCKFPCEVPRVELFKVIEILEMTDKAKKSICDVTVWNAENDR